MGRCVWLCDFSLLLRSLYGLLVCAEGYTQVTGVVAMMMTGRVLLVCALCVLWCGVCGGDGTPPASDTAVTENETQILNGSSPKPSFTGVSGGDDKKPQNVSGSSQTTSGTGGSGEGANRQFVNSTIIDGAGGGGNHGQVAEPSKAVVEAETPILSPEVKVGEEALKTTESVTEEKKEKEEEEEEVQEEVEREEEGDDDEEEDEEKGEKEEKEGEDDKENVTSAQKGMSAGGQEQPSLSSGAEGASNKTKLNSTQTTDGSTTAS
ncbi:mucin-associated surface protein (MASP), putative, partial [Trypanosoma cruzi marinkellei]